MFGLTLPRLLAQLFFLTLFSLASLNLGYAADAQKVIGQVVWTEGSITASQPGQPSRSLARRSPIFEKDTINTGPQSAGEIVFTDNSVMTLTENSTVQIDHYNYGQNNTPTQNVFAVNVIKGGFRTITGAIGATNPDGYHANTPVATIGVHGTQFIVYYDPKSHKTVTKLERGSIVVSNDAGSVVLTKCDKTTNREQAGQCIDQVYAEVNGENAAPEVITTDPFTPGPSSSSGGSTTVSSFCLQ